MKIGWKERNKGIKRLISVWKKGVR